MEQLKQDFADDLLVVKRHFPLTNIHDNAIPAARAAEAAGRQGMFEEMADMLFQNQDEWKNEANAQPLFESYGTSIGLDLDQFRADLSDPAIEARINRDLDVATALNLPGTPAFFLGGKQIPTPTFEEFPALIQSEVDAMEDEVFALNRRTGEIFVADGAALDFETTPSFGLNVNVTNGDSSKIQATINLLDVNEVAPISQADSYVANQDDALTVTAGQGVLSNDSDADSPSLTATLVTQASNGVVSLSPDGSFTYTPNVGFLGSDSFTYEADDGDFSSRADVTIAVELMNTAPSAVDDSYSVKINEVLTVSPTLGVLANDNDTDGDQLTATLVDQPENGTLALNSDGSFTYRPDDSFVGIDSFSYMARDGDANSNLAAALIDVAIAEQAVPDFTLSDVNPLSSSEGEGISPRDYLQQVSGWYFGHST